MNENFWMGMLGLAIVLGGAAAVLVYSHWRERLEREGYFSDEPEHQQRRPENR